MERAATTRPNIFEYLDYRQYLIDSFQAIQARNPRFSHRAFARNAGFTSPNLLQLVTSGQRGLPVKSIPALANALGLSRTEAEFLQDLVQFAHARSLATRDAIYRKILRCARFKEAQPLAKERYECFRNWWIPVVRELATHPDCKASAEWIAERIRPRVTVAQVEKTLATLRNLELLHLQKRPARYVRSDLEIRTTPEVTSTAIADYHRTVLSLAAESIETVPRSERDIRSATLGVSLNTARLLKERMTALWQEVLEEAGRETVPEVVIQWNTQIFPLTTSLEESP